MTDDEYYGDPTPEELATTEFPTLGPTIDDDGTRRRDPTDRELVYLDEQRELYRLASPTAKQKARTREVVRWLCLSMNGRPPSRPLSQDVLDLLRDRLK